MNTFNDQLKIGEIVSQDYRAAGLFRKYGIDFCCGGGISLAEACRRKNLDTQSLLGELEQVLTNGTGRSENYNSWSIPLLITYIQETHHRYVRAKTDELLAFASKVAWRHGDTHPENVQIYQTFSDLVPELMEHLESEEQRVFPLIQRLHEEIQSNGTVSEELRNELMAEFKEMEEEHEAAGNAMKKIRGFSRDFTPPEGACTTYRVLYQGLADFEADLHKHVHLENNILFRKAEALLK